MTKRTHLFFAIIFAGVLSGPVVAKEIIISAGQIPPHMTQDGTGREAEIISATLESCGHQAKFIVQPFPLRWDRYKNDPAVDAVATVADSYGLPGTQSVAYINYHDGVSVMGDRSPKSLDDLSGLNVVAFTGAESLLPRLKAARPTFQSYHETSDQPEQVRQLFAGRVDAVIGDGLIFANSVAQLRAQNQKQPHAEVRFHPIFAPTPYHMVFRDPALQQDFDRCYGVLKAAGKIDAINNAYLKDHRATLGRVYQGL